VTIALNELLVKVFEFDCELRRYAVQPETIYEITRNFYELVVVA
jgi:hypothetical protein